MRWISINEIHSHIFFTTPKQIIIINQIINMKKHQEIILNVLKNGNDTMTSSCIEIRENQLKNTAKKAQEKAKQAEIKLKQTQEKAKQEKQNTKNILKEITQNIDENGKLNPKTLQKI